MELKDRLKQSRKRAGKTQAEVAEAVKMSQPAYQGLRIWSKSEIIFPSTDC
jgi:transcriptional regulator with XRE-family HTH domain